MCPDREPFEPRRRMPDDQVVDRPRSNRPEEAGDAESEEPPESTRTALSCGLDIGFTVGSSKAEIDILPSDFRFPPTLALRVPKL